MRDTAARRDAPKTTSRALENPESTSVGARVAATSRQHDGHSGFRIITVGVDGFLLRAQMINAAERTLDLQYFIFRGDETGRLLTDLLVRAADRGVRVRVLVDDGNTKPGDEQIYALDAHPSIEVRVFNPFTYRGHNLSRRALEFGATPGSIIGCTTSSSSLTTPSRWSAGAISGNEYFQMDPEGQFADDDVFVAGPVAGKLSKTFDEFSEQPVLDPGDGPGARQTAGDDGGAPSHACPGATASSLQGPGIDYVSRLASGEPYASMLPARHPSSGRPPR